MYDSNFCCRSQLAEDVWQCLWSCRDAAVDDTIESSHRAMTRVSRQLARGRTAGEYSNYGERLYAEGLMELEKRRALVSGEQAYCACPWLRCVITQGLHVCCLLVHHCNTCIHNVGKRLVLRRTAQMQAFMSVGDQGFRSNFPTRQYAAAC